LVIHLDMQSSCAYTLRWSSPAQGWVWGIMPAGALFSDGIFQRTGTGFTVPVLAINQLHQYARVDGLTHAHLALQLLQFGVNLGILLQLAEAVFE
jgi:hypothetical protein